MLDKVKAVHVLVGLVILTASATAGAMVYFADKDMVQVVRASVKDNAEEIAMMKESDKLSIYLDRLTEIENDCLDRKTDEWLCSDEKHQKYMKLKVHTKKLMKDLGIEDLEL